MLCSSTRLKLALLVGLCAGGFASAIAKDAIKFDFEGPFSPIPELSASQRIHGALPEGLADDSSWADLDLVYSAETGTTFSGKQSLKLSASHVQRGWAQLTLRGLSLDKQHFTRISAAFIAPGAMKVTLFLRKREYPYTTYWEQSFDVRPEWRPMEFLVPPIVEDSDALLTITTKSEGVLMLDDLVVEFPSVDSIEQNAHAKEGNQLVNSSFPFGLVGQWVVQHGRFGLNRAFPDPAMMGPTGVPALQFGVGGEKEPFENMNSRLVSPAIALNGGRPHGVGFYARGSREGQAIQVALFDPASAKNGITKVVNIGPDWQWVRVEGDLPYSLHGYYNLSISAGERLWIDGVVVREGKDAPAFERSAAVEVSLKPSRPYALYFPEEAFQCDFALVGDLAQAARLDLTLSDPYGRDIPVDSIDLKADAATRAFTLPLKHSRKLGTYLLGVQAVDADGKKVSRAAELAIHRVHHPRSAHADAPDSPFGTHINPTLWEARMVKDLGFNWVRVHDGGQEVTGWYFLETSPGKFDFTYSDRAVDILRSQHLSILGMLNMAPSFYTDCPKDYPQNDHTRQYFVVRNEYRAKWQEYVRQIVGRNAGKITAWEVLNEPYAGQTFFIKRAERQASGSYRMIPGTAENYVQVFGDAYTAAREANPAARLVWMMNHETGWNDKCIQAGITDYADIASYHYYLVHNPLEGYPKTRFSKVADRLRGELAAAGKNLPFWNTEGSGTNLQVPWKNSPAYEEGACDAMANGLVRSYISFLSQGSDKWFVYSSHIFGVWAPYYYGFTAPDGTLAPSATILSSFMWLMEGKKFDRSLPVAEGVTAFVFTGKDESLVVLASNLGEKLAVTSIPAKWSLLDWYGNTAKAEPVSKDNVAYLVLPRQAGEPEYKQIAALKLLPPE